MRDRLVLSTWPGRLQMRQGSNVCALEAVVVVVVLAEEDGDEL